MSTNSHHSNAASKPRRMACRTCRDRKVRCDGAQPSCERCLRSGEECVYQNSFRASKAELQETVDKLSSRLGRAEQLLAQQRRQQSQPIENNGSHHNSPNQSRRQTVIEIPQQPIQPQFDVFSTSPTFSDKGYPWASNAPISISARNVDEIKQEQQSGAGPPDMTATAADWEATAALIMDDLPDASLDTVGDDILIDSFAYEQKHPWSSLSGPETMPSTANGRPGPEVDTHSGSSRTSSSSGRKLPSLRDVRDWNSMFTGLPRRKSSHAGGGDEEKDSADALVKDLSSFISTISGVQTEIVGIASALADYAAWGRRAQVEDTQEVLKLVESRTREIAELATLRLNTAWGASRTSLASHAQWRGILREREEEITQQALMMANFFRTNYDIHCPLSQQR